MSNATTATINISSLGIQDMEKHINAGDITVAAVLAVLDHRIDKRIAEKRPLLKPVVEYRNQLAASYEAATGISVGMVAVPTYAKVQPNAALPTDPEQLADVVFATVGASQVGQVIARLTARVVSA